jgi:hypothetical protein
MTGGRKERRGTENHRKKKRKKNLAKYYCMCTLRELALFASTSWPKTRSTNPAPQRVHDVDADKLHPSNKINTYQIAEARIYTTHFSIFLERVI